MNIPLNIDWQQILLHLLNFVILAGGLYLLLYKPVKTFMEKRQQYYPKPGPRRSRSSPMPTPPPSGSTTSSWPTRRRS